MNLRKYLCLLLLAAVMPLAALAQQVIDDDDVTSTDNVESIDSLQLDSINNICDEPEKTHAQIIADRVRALMHDPLFKRTQVGLCVYDLTDDSLIYAYHWQYRLRPASNAKIITAVTALDLLSSEYKYRTTLLTNYEPDTAYVQVNDSVVRQKIYLNGNLYVHGGFDPIFGKEDMAFLVGKLKERGISEIKGNIVFDYSMKDENRLGWGWCWDDEEVPLVSLLYNGKDEFVSAFSDQLEKAGITLQGKYLGDVTPDTTIIFYQMERPISEVLKTMMKSSDNLYAESMFYQLAAQSGSRGVGRKEAAATINDLVSRLGLDYTVYEFADGSGLSLYNYATPELLLKLLCYAYDNPEIYDTLLPSMPIAGVDGTLRKRMIGTPAQNNVQAKTGTVTGVSTLSGYCTASNGHRLAFSIMNNGLRNASQGRSFQDRVCIALCK